MNIIIADDHKIFAEGLASLLKINADIETVVVATDVELHRALKEKQFGVAIIDIELGETDGRDVAKKAIKSHPDCKYVALSSHSEPTIIKSALKGAFNGYVLKTDSLDTIIKCIHTVIKGETFVSPHTSVKLINDASGTTTKNFIPKLTRREKEVLECIAKEMNTKEIAVHLFISEKTVEVHRGNLMLKLDAKNMAGLMRRAYKLGLLN